VLTYSESDPIAEALTIWIHPLPWFCSRNNGQ
jgi:hypothetical protein